MLLQVFIVSSKKIQERNYETLFRWLTQSNKINIIGRVVLSVPPMWQASHAPSNSWSPVVSLLLWLSKEPVVRVLAAVRLRPRVCMRVMRLPHVTGRCPRHKLCLAQPLAYMCVHIALTTMTFALCKLWWASYVAHTTFLLFIFAISAWNGAAPSLLCMRPTSCMPDWDTCHVMVNNHLFINPAHPAGMLFRSRRQNAEKPAVGSGNDSYIDETSAEIQSPTVGASYYFDYFSKHYFEGVNKRS